MAKRSLQALKDEFKGLDLRASNGRLVNWTDIYRWKHLRKKLGQVVGSPEYKLRKGLIINTQKGSF